MYYNVFKRKEVKIVAIVTLRLNEKEEALFRNYANLTGKRLSELFKNTLAERIEDEFDLDVYYDAFAEYQADSETMTHADFKKELGL